MFDVLQSIFSNLGLFEPYGDRCLNHSYCKLVDCIRRFVLEQIYHRNGCVQRDSRRIVRRCFSLMDFTDYVHNLRQCVFKARTKERRVEKKELETMGCYRQRRMRIEKDVSEGFERDGTSSLRNETPE